MTNFFLVLISVALIPMLKKPHIQYSIMLILLWGTLKAVGTLLVVAIIEES